MKRGTVTLTVAYDCAYCGKPLYHRGDLQPSINFAQCWECWAADATAKRQVLENRLAIWPALAFAAFVAGLFVGIGAS